MTATTVPAEVPISEARAILTDIATAAKEHGARTALTKHGKTMAVVVSADAANCPDPELWRAAREAHDNLNTLNLPTQSRHILSILGRLLDAYDDGEERS